MPLLFPQKKIGFVFQAFNLVSSVNVWEILYCHWGWMEEKWMKRM